MPLYSHSKLSTYETCPLKYKLQYIERPDVVKKEGIEAFLGKRVHEALEKLYRNLRYSRLITLDELLNYYNDQWSKNWNDSVDIAKIDLTADNYKDTGIKCIRNYYQRHAPFENGVPIGIEEKITFPLSEDGGYAIQGFIDRLDRTKENIYEIHDYKTSGSLPLQEDLDEDRQLALYELGIRKKYPDVRDVRLIWHYLLFDMELSSERTSEQIEVLRKETIALIDVIEADKEFKHRESNLCGWCDYWAYCPAKKHIAMTDALPAEQYLEEDGVRLVNEYVSAWNKSKEADVEKERLKERLAAYAKKEGMETIVGSDFCVKVTFKENQKLPENNSPDRVALEKIIKDAGLWNEASRLDGNVLAKIIESNKWDKELVDRIKQFMFKEEGVRVSQPKMVKGEE
ncbi:MAG: PD-(D/E)XK nuclease family protein [Candidatus Omnitrophica bacterium]|nr:PD-(D/E)XK nuclease family protein [Candidatus Omnitrophota bacterium]